MRRAKAWISAKLHRRIFIWFGVAILSTATVFSVVQLLSPGGPGWAEDKSRVKRFIGQRYEAVWDDSDARSAMSEEAATELAIGVSVFDAAGNLLSRHGDEETQNRPWIVEVERDGQLLGTVHLYRAPPVGAVVMFIISLVLSILVLWGFSMFAARKLMRPLNQVVRVANEIGDGKFSSRAQLDRRYGEVAMLAESINEMARRIEKQLADQRELLAAVSHEIRTPLGHMRVLLEIAEDKADDPTTLREIEKEILAVDALVDQLLASSRLEFDSLDERPLSAVSVATSALDRAGLSVELLRAELAEAEDDGIRGDPTLLAQALANLLSNAEKHGEGVTGMRVWREGRFMCFEVLDLGPGFLDEEVERVFDSFFRGHRRAGASHGSVGLGLSLVRRIAKAHQGYTWVRNRDAGGARVGFAIATQRAPRVTEPTREELAESAAAHA